MQRHIDDLEKRNTNNGMDRNSVFSFPSSNMLESQGEAVVLAHVHAKMVGVSSDLDGCRGALKRGLFSYFPLCSCLNL